MRVVPVPAGSGPGTAARWRDGAWLRAALLDVSLAALAAYAAVLLAAEWASTAGAAPAARNAVVAAAFAHGSAIAVRRAATGVMLAALLATAVVGAALGQPVYLLGPATLIATYTVGARWPRRRGLATIAAVDAAALLLMVAGPGFPGPDSVALFLGLITAAWFLGDTVRRWQTLAGEHAAQVGQLRAAREELARHAVTAERVRIARELHDVVAHGMSIVAMHAGAARLAIGQDPQAERAALEVIEETTRGALREMRRLVAVLREDGDPQRGLAPIHSLGDLPTLIAGVAAAGVSIDVRTSGDLAGLPDGISLAAYRVIQEALTNVVQHAGPTRARVVVDVGPDGAVELTVENDPGPRRPGSDPAGSEPAGGDPAGGGHGTHGMRERAGLYGGTLVSAPTGDGGWRVTARFPADRRATEATEATR